MHLPKKITPDNIKEAVIEVKYFSKLPFEVLVGLFFDALDNTYTYTNRPLQSPLITPTLQPNAGQEITFKIGNLSLFYNSKISIQVTPNGFVFTCLNQYIGWDDYFPEIQKALKQIETSNQVAKWTRVGVRYISEYEKTDLKDRIKFNFSFGLPQVQSETTAFRGEFNYNNSRVILNLNNRVPVITQKQSSKQPEIVLTSIIDIDVIRDNLEISNLDELLKVIETNHIYEKEVYFGMLTDEFLNSLNPQY
jgi:uncharacterized protein (TIGR04255 family)